MAFLSSPGLDRAQEVKKYESKRTANKSTYWVIFELTWRDYYRFFALRFGDAIFLESGITDRRVRHVTLFLAIYALN